MKLSITQTTNSPNYLSAFLMFHKYSNSPQTLGLFFNEIMKNQHAAQGSLPLILRHYKWDSANTNTVPIKVVRTGYQAFENSIMRTLFSTVKDVDYITSE